MEIRSTSRAWVQAALEDLSAFLQDHAACERKAAAQCMALVSRYHDRPWLMEPLTAMAREELLHFMQVFRIMRQRGIPLSKDSADPYVSRLRERIRGEDSIHLADRLLASAMIEARSAERLALVAGALEAEGPYEDPELAPLYRRFAKEEKGHFRVFTDLAIKAAGEDVVRRTLPEWLAWEAEAMESSPHRPAVH